MKMFVWLIPALLAAGGLAGSRIGDATRSREWRQDDFQSENQLMAGDLARRRAHVELPEDGN